MRTSDHRLGFASSSLEATCETMLLGRLGHEIARIYHDTLHSPLPPRLQELIDRLDDVTGESQSESGDLDR